MAAFGDLVDLADNDGEVVYIIKQHNALTGHNYLGIESEWKKGTESYAPPEKKHLPFLLPRAENVIKYFEKDDDEQLFNDVGRFLKRFSYLPDSKWLMITCFTFLTYLADFDDIHYLPEMLFFAEPARGKSRTGKAVTYLAYRGTYLADVREPNIIRFSNNLHASLFIDTKDFWRKVQHNHSEDIFLFRFEKGAKVSRV